MTTNDHERPVPENEPPSKRARLNDEEEDAPVPYLFIPFDHEATLWLWTPPPGPDGERLKTLLWRYLEKKKISDLTYRLATYARRDEDDLKKRFPKVAAFPDRGEWEAFVDVGSTRRVNAVLYWDD